MFCLIWTGFLLTAVMACVSSEFIQPPPSLSLRSFTEGETRLPCEFRPQDDDRVVQVTWYREKSDGTKEQIITQHMSEGLQEFPGFEGRVRFAGHDPITDSTLLIENTKESDQATYTCHITTFPSGNFERHINLNIWRIPISTIDPVILEEGQSYRMAATCRAVGLPPPRLSWDTDIPGQSQNKSSDDGIVTSNYFLHPLRNMNGRKLDCLVWHPALEGPRRLSHKLVIYFPPDAVVTGYDQSWAVNREGAELKCEGGGNPKPNTFLWTRMGSEGLPKDVSMVENRLIFNRPLNVTDGGIYQCEAKNTVGSVKAEVHVQISAFRLKGTFNNLLIIIVGGAAGALVVIMAMIILLVTCQHRRRTRRLKSELRETKAEIHNISRNASMRRINSFSNDLRIQNEDCALIGMNSSVKNSTFSLERDRIRDGEFDSLGRPAIYPASRSDRGSIRREMDIDKQEHLRRVESYVRNSQIYLDSDHQGERSPAPLSVSSGYQKDGGSDKEGWGQREGVPEGEEADCSLSSQQLSEAITNLFHYSNGGLVPKSQRNAIILRPHSQII